MVSVARDIRRAQAMLTDVQHKQLPFATAKAINDVAFQVMRSEGAAMSQVFAHPRPFTAKSVRVAQKATKSTPVALVAVRREAAAYLAPYEFGGLHHLAGRGLALLNPKDIRTDAFGQLRGKPRAIGSRPGVFVGTVITKSGPVAGFWRRVRSKGDKRKRDGKGFRPGGLQLLIRFGKASPVHKHLDFRKRGEALVRARFATALRVALVKALGTANR